MTEIRPAKLGDGSAIVSLIQEMAVTSGDASPITISNIEEYLASPGSYVLLATDGNGISGLSPGQPIDLYDRSSQETLTELKKGLHIVKVGYHTDRNAHRPG
jgi:hypothetical protein